MASLGDIALITQVKVFGNKRAFDQLVRRYQSPVRRLLLNLTLGNQSLSDDLAQETFIKAYTHIGQFQGTSSFQTWLFSIAYRVFYDDRRRRREVSGDGREETNAASSSLHSPLSSVSTRIDIYQALSLLKDDERTCITLQLIDGEPIDRIAEITGIGQNTVKSHLRRGKEKLANYLRQNGYG